MSGSPFPTQEITRALSSCSRRVPRSFQEGRTVAAVGAAGKGRRPSWDQPYARTEPVSRPLTARTSHTTVRSPPCQAAWFG